MLDYTVYGAVLLGVAAAAFLVARSPSFWSGMAVLVFKAILPIILKRKSPEDEKKWRDSILRGGTGEFDKWGKEIDKNG